MDKYEILKKYYGYKDFKEEQNLIIDNVMNNIDTIGLLPTGFGKSLIFVTLSLMLEGISIIITPLIALMVDQVNNLKSRGVKAEYLNSTLNFNEINKVYKKMIDGNVKILYVSAERLQNEYFKRIIKNINVSLIVLDEAHTVLWSEDFRIAISKIGDFINLLKNRPKLLALTATATDETVNKIIKYLNLRNPKIIESNFDKKNIYYRIVKTNNKLNELIKVVSRYKDELGIIYSLTIKECNMIYDYLKNLGFKVGYYYGTLDSRLKEDMQNDFKNHKIKIMVCTNAFGMGIDIPDIRYVIEYDMPLCIEDFVQQTGRASRDGLMAEAILFFDVNDIKTINYFIDNIEIDKPKDEINKIKKSKYIKLDKMVGLCLTKGCIHKYISNYFHQNHSGKCMMCCNCKSDFLKK